MSAQPTQQWVTAERYSQIYSISIQTLANWRFKDRRAGRKTARPGFPKYRYFGTAVRYEIEPEISVETGT